jgi:GDP-L-fucose synthase
MLAWWQKYQPQAKMICIGTSCAYEPESEIVEENYLKGAPIDSLYTYAMTKRMLYAGLLALNMQFGLKYICLVPSTLYGPCYHTDGRQMHFIFDLIRKIIRGKLYDKRVVLWGDGYQSRDLIYVEDFVRIMIMLSDNYENQLINIGTGEGYTIRHYAKIICDKTVYDFDKIYFDTSGYVGAVSKCLVVKKMRCLQPDIELTSLDEGLAKTIDWFWSQGENLLHRE